MKALIISSLLFFSLRAMSADVGQNLKGDCQYSTQTNVRAAKVVSAPSESSAVKPQSSKTIGK
jgi:hypothetical protein